LPVYLGALETTTSNGAVAQPRGGFFPRIYFTNVIEAIRRTEDAKPYWVSTENELEAEREARAREITDYTSLLLNNDILAYYGHPRSRIMGILGRYPIADLDRRLTELAAEYEAAGGRNVIKAFYIIFGTVWPRGEIGYINADLLRHWVEYALENDILIFIDHQIGRYDPIASLEKMLPWLQYPNVHLALDPEWRTSRPMAEIGYVTGEEINRAQQIMEDYLYDNDLPGERFLVIHQFMSRMIRDRDDVRSNFRRVRVVHCADGFGSPAVKRSSYTANARAENMPVKSFKLFYNFGTPGAGYDHPLMTPSEVYALTPRPQIIMYQ